MSTGERIIDLEVGANPIIDATTETVTDELDFGRSYKWSIMARLDGTDGTPQMVIEGSNDGVDWVNPYSDCDDNTLPLVIDLDAPINTAFDDIFPFSRYRIRTLPNDNTTGTLSYKLCLHFQ